MDTITLSTVLELMLFDLRSYKSGSVPVWVYTVNIGTLKVFNQESWWKIYMRQHSGKLKLECSSPPSHLSVSDSLTDLIAAGRLVQLRLEAQHLCPQPVSAVHQLGLEIKLK